MCAMDSDDFYEILGISRDASANELKKAYRRMAMRYHPDKNQGNQAESERMFKKVSEAYDVLSDPAKKQIYDRFGIEGLRGNQGVDAAGGFRFTDPDVIFSRFFTRFAKDGNFGRAFGGTPFGDFRPPQRPAFRDVVKVEVACSLEELYAGTIKKMRIRRTSIRAKRPDTQLIEIVIKPGWKADTRVICQNAGNEVHPGVFQDIVFIVREKKHRHFRRQGSNLYYQANLTLAEALTGCTLHIPMLDETTLDVEVDQVVHPNYVKILRGKGMPSSQRPDHFGDLHVSFNVEYPKTLTSKQKAAIREALQSGKRTANY